MLYHDKNKTTIGGYPSDCDVYYITIDEDDEFLICFNYRGHCFISMYYTGRLYTLTIECNDDIDELVICEYMNALNISPYTIIDNYLRDDIQHILNNLLDKLIAVHTLYMDCKDILRDGVKRIMFPSNMKRAE